jgi:uncharacterized membrane protein
MARVEKSIVINAPVDTVFAFVDDPANLPSVWPALQEIKDVVVQPDGGHSSNFVYNMGGMRFSGHTDTIERVPNQLLVTQSKSGIENTLRWGFQPEGGGTKLTLVAEYKVPVPLVGRIAEAILLRQNEQQAETVLANLKQRMEA